MRAILDLPTTATINERESFTGRERVGLLIATDGRPAADGAIIVGRSIAHRDGEPQELVAVEALERLSERPGGTIIQHDLPLRLAQQRARTTDVARDSWPLSIAYGSPDATIAELADHTQRRLIVLGLHVHPRRDRWLGRETVLRVMQRANCPVLAVDSNRRTIPRRTLLAIDFSPSSIAAAAEALRVVGDTGLVYFVHVIPRTAIPFDAGVQPIYEPDVRMRLALVERGLDIPPNVDTRIAVLRGDPAKELLAFAEQEGMELIATGSHGQSALRGPVIGSVPTALVRAARCSVLVMPT